MPPFNPSPNSGNGDLKINNQNFQNVGEMKSEKVEDTLVPATQVPKSYDLVQDRETAALVGVLPEGHLEQEKYTETFDRLKELTNGDIDINDFLEKKQFLTQEEINEAGLILDKGLDKRINENKESDDEYLWDEVYMDGRENNRFKLEVERIAKELVSVLNTTIEYKELETEHGLMDSEVAVVHEWSVDDKGEVISLDRDITAHDTRRHSEDEPLEAPSEAEVFAELQKAKIAAIKMLASLSQSTNALSRGGSSVQYDGSTDHTKESFNKVEASRLRALHEAIIAKLPHHKLFRKIMNNHTGHQLCNLLNNILTQGGYEVMTRTMGRQYSFNYGEILGFVSEEYKNKGNYY